ncbi:MAG: translocation/assembly module TamB [Treponema sp.]|nr:translocation/assembly module TamB [Treponema sp.]
MPIFTGKNRKKGIPHLLYVKILILSIITVISGFALMPVQNFLSMAIASIRVNIIERLETVTGLEISYSSIRPSFLSSFDIRNLQFRNSSAEILSIPRARVYYSIREIIINKKIIINSIQIDRPVLDINMERDREFIDSLRNFSSGQNEKKILAQISEFLPVNGDYRIRRCRINFSGGENTVNLTGMNVNLRVDKDGFLFGARTDAQSVLAQLADRSFAINSEIAVNGNYSINNDEIRAEIVFLKFAFSQMEDKNQKPLFTMNPFSMGFYFINNSFNIRSQEANKDGYFHFSLDTLQHGIIAQINMNNFNPVSIANFSDHLKNVLVWADREATGSLSLMYNYSGELDYRIKLQSGILAGYANDPLSLTDSIYISAYGDKNQINIEDMRLNIPANTALDVKFNGNFNYSGRVGLKPLSPQGVLSVERFTFTGAESVNGVFNLSSYGRNIEISSENISVGTHSLKKIDVSLYPMQKETAVSVSGLSSDNGRIYLDAVLNNNPGQIEASLILDSFSVFNIAESIRPFYNFFKLPPLVFSRNMTLDGEIFFSSNFSDFAYNAPNITIKDDKTIALLSFSGTDSRFSLTEGTFYINNDTLFIYANADTSDPMDLDFSLRANYLDVSWNIDGQILDRTTLVVRDPLGLHAYGNISSNGAVSGYIEGVNYPFPAKTHPAYVDFFIGLRYNARDFWSLDIDNFTVRNLHSNNGFISLSFLGNADQKGAVINNILFSDDIGKLTGTTDFSWKNDFSSLGFIFNMTDSRENGEFCLLQGETVGGHFNIKGNISNVRIDRFVGGRGPMLASADAQINWNSADSFNAVIGLSSFNAKLQKNEIHSSMDMVITDSDLYIQNLNLNYANIETFFPEFYVNTREGTGRISADISGYAGNRALNADMHINAIFEKIDSWLNIKNAFNSFDGTLQFNNFVFGSINRENVLFTFSGNDDLISFSDRMTDMIRLEMDREGNFFLSLSDPAPVRGSFAGVFKKGHIDAYCNNYFIDLDSLWNIAMPPIKDFNITGGFVSGKMNFKGPFWNPEFSGTGTAASVNMNVPNYVSEDIRSVPFQITAQGYEMTFGPVIISSGTGSATVNGWFGFENWVPRNIGLNINIPGETSIPYNIKIASFHADGNTSGKLNLNLDTNNNFLEITGALVMNNTEMNVNMDEISSRAESEFGDEKKLNVVAALTITTGSMVEFFWPNKHSPILRANPEMGTTFKISSETESGHYSLVSDIKIRTGELFYFDRNFFIRQGTMTFREDELKFDPMISARAEIRDQSDTGPVTISLIIDNQPLRSFVPRFESSPGLTQLEIYSILGQNFNNIQDGNNDTTQRFLLASSADIFTQFFANSEVLSQILYFRQIERSLRKFLNLDMLSIRTRLIQNAVVSTSSAMFNLSPIDRIGSVGNYIDNTTVFIGKYVGQDMFVQSTVKLKYDENSVLFGGLKIEPDFGIELQSPFVNIRWAFFPYHPENWWINDNSVTLFWSKSF